MNKERMDEIEKLAEAATPGPWEACGCRFSIVTTKISPQESMDVCDTKINDAISCEQAERNNYFIAAARTAVPELLAAVRERDAEIERYRKQLQGLNVLYAARIQRHEETEEGLDEQTKQLSALRARCAELEADNKSAVEKLAASVEAGAKLMEEKNVLANRCAALEKVREAAEAYCTASRALEIATEEDWPIKDKIPLGMACGSKVDALRAALADARGK